MISLFVGYALHDFFNNSSYIFEKALSYYWPIPESIQQPLTLDTSSKPCACWN